MAQFISVNRFEKFQHYRDRKPPWIKLYRDLLSDDRLFDLSEGDRWHLVGLFILASQHDNLIPYKPAWIKKELSLTRPISLKVLIDTGWVSLVERDASGLLAASELLAGRKQEPIVEVETEGEKSREEAETYSAHGEFGHCRLTAAEQAKLEFKIGARLAHYVNRFDRFLEENPKERKTRKAYLTILNWFDRDGDKSESMSPAQAATPKYTPAQIAEATAKLKAGGVIIREH